MKSSVCKDQIQNYLEKMQRIQTLFLDFIENQVDYMNNFEDIINFVEKELTSTNIHDLKLVLHLLTSISSNHYQSENIFKKIEQILNFFKEKIQQNLSNAEIYEIFKNDKRILLFLIEEKILTIDKTIYKQMCKKNCFKNNYLHYFYPEIKEFIEPELRNKFTNELPDDFYEKRRKGENDSYICELIRNDLIDDFIVFVNKNNLSLDLIMNQSIYETNSILNDFELQHSYIEYAAFYGSIRIFKYLLINHVEMKESLWLYAIHGRNAEIIHLVDENCIIKTENYYTECFIESIKCHHNNIAEYIKNNFLNDIDKFDIIASCLKYYNFAFIDCELIKNSFYYLCHYDYYQFVKLLVKNDKIDINQIKNIFIQFFQIIEFQFNYNNKTVLIDAIERENVEIIKLLLENEKLDVNLFCI